MLKADFHIHTNEDKRDLITYCARELVDAAAERKFEVLAITNHNIFTYTPELAEYASLKGIFLVPGIESTIEGKHVIILNPQQDVESIKTFEALKEYRKNHPEIFVLAPHPYYPHLRKYSLKPQLLKNIDLFDGIEYCHYYTRIFDHFNSKARKVAVKYGKPIIGTSDAHHLFQLDKTYTMVDAEKNIDSIISALRHNKIKIVSRPLSLFMYSKASILIFFKFIIKRIIFLMRRENPPHE
ncbi:MAG TPA: hypothetical protein DET40_13905 [Lentisphaeria bacterium]|nr:MAG: hypothetical protein A2X45_04975 [Lentisphaerae bacterium GWF2_50_93]HCE44635.1 hypothetical protein [Lentisphaeria bacterium]